MGGYSTERMSFRNEYMSNQEATHKTHKTQVIHYDNHSFDENERGSFMWGLLKTQSRYVLPFVL